jgi:hypothetical protein
MVSISCQDAETSDGNIHHLLNILQTTFGTMTSVGDDLDLLGVSERQSQLLSACTDHLERFKDEALQGEECDIVVAAEHLRAAAACLARITGRGEAGDVEEVLGVVFEKFVPLQCPSIPRAWLTVTDSAWESEPRLERRDSIWLKTALYPRTPQKCQSTNRWSLKQILHPNAAKEIPIYPMPLKQIHPMQFEQENTPSQCR